MHPARPTCVGNFLTVWRDQLVRDYKMDVSVICCEWNRCNGPNAMASRPQILHNGLKVLVFAVIIKSSDFITRGHF